eukprot:1161189-Pelagomonas_calceolata.AAC.10
MNNAVRSYNVVVKCHRGQICFGTTCQWRASWKSGRNMTFGEKTKASFARLLVGIHSCHSLWILPALFAKDFVPALALLCRNRLEDDAEKVHNMLRHAMIVDLVVEAGRPGRPDLSFRQWLSDNGVLSLTTRQRPGPIVPEAGQLLNLHMKVESSRYEEEVKASVKSMTA